MLANNRKNLYALKADRIVCGDYVRGIYNNIQWRVRRNTQTYWSLYIDYNRSALSGLYKITDRDHEQLHILSNGRKRADKVLIFDFNKFRLDYTPEYYLYEGVIKNDCGEDVEFRSFGYVYGVAKKLIDYIINTAHNKENVPP